MYKRFRMAELERRSGYARTTLHYYQRLGMLPPPVKTAANAALYGAEHLERLAVIRRLRSAEFGELPIKRVRRLLDRVEKGVSLEVAVELDREVMGGSASRNDEAMTEAQATAQAGVSLEEMREMVRLGILIPDPFGRGEGFDDVDIRVARAVRNAVVASKGRLDDVAPVAALLAHVVDHEMDVRNRAVAALTADANARVTLALQQAANLLHTYLLSRGLECAIARHEQRKRQARPSALA
jgi:DNA-binding transcriptional MerR regulator